MPAAPLICCRKARAQARQRRDHRAFSLKKASEELTEFSLCHRMFACISSSSAWTSAMLLAPRSLIRETPASSTRSFSRSQRGLVCKCQKDCEVHRVTKNLPLGNEWRTGTEEQSRDKLHSDGQPPLEIETLCGAPMGVCVADPESQRNTDPN